MSASRNRDEPNSGLDDPELLALLTEQGLNVPGKDDNNDIRDDDSGDENEGRKVDLIFQFKNNFRKLTLLKVADYNEHTNIINY